MNSSAPLGNMASGTCVRAMSAKLGDQHTEMAGQAAQKLAPAPSVGAVGDNARGREDGFKVIWKIVTHWESQLLADEAVAQLGKEGNASAGSQLNSTCLCASILTL